MTPGGPTLVTGAAGFIGSHLARRLAREGVQVRAVDVTAFPASLDHPLIETHEVDVRDRGALRELLHGVDVVFHLASVHLEVHASERAFLEVNVEAVEGLVEDCARAGVRRVVHASSVGIYGHVERPPVDEDGPKRPVTAYERTKLAGEERALDAARRHGLDLIVVRPAWVYGPECPRTGKLVDAVRGGRFFFVGDGSNLRHPVHIDDTLDGLLLAAKAPESASGAAYILAGPRPMPLREMVSAVARVLDVPPPRIRIPRPIFWMMALAAETAFRPLGRHPPFSRRTISFFSNDNAFTTSRAEEALGYRPRIDFEEGLRRTLGVGTGGGSAR